MKRVNDGKVHRIVSRDVTNRATTACGLEGTPEHGHISRLESVERVVDTSTVEVWVTCPKCQRRLSTYQRKTLRQALERGSFIVTADPITGRAHHKSARLLVQRGFFQFSDPNDRRVFSLTPAARKRVEAFKKAPTK